MLRRINTPYFPLALVSLLFAAGCGGDDPSDPGSGSSGQNQADNGDGEPGNGNGNGGGGNGETEGPTPQWPGAQPCQDFDTGFDGDDMCLAVPDPEAGFQLRYGPNDYDDPDELAKYLIDPGDEITDCVFTKTPNEEMVYINQYHARLRPGTHHMITYTQPNAVPDSDGPVSCNQGADFTFLVGATTLVTDIAREANGAPEDEGLALPIPARSQAAVQMHYINTTDEPILRDGWINVMYVDPADVVAESQPVTWLGGIGMAVPPRSQQLITAGGRTCSPSESQRLVTLVAHAHANTVRVTSYLQRAGSSEREMIYETYDWAEPTFFNYNSVEQNPLPDPVAGTDGAASGIIRVEPGDQLSWECDVVNEHDNVTLTFGNEAYTAEMCNMFGVYTTERPPGDEPVGPWRCISL